MRWLILCLGLSSAAFAADPEQGWLVSTSSSKRFVDGTVNGPEFSAGTRVVVLAHEGDLVRVSVGDRYGWVPSAALTDKAPAGAPPAGLPTIPGMPDVKVLPALPKP